MPRPPRTGAGAILAAIVLALTGALPALFPLSSRAQSPAPAEALELPASRAAALDALAAPDARARLGGIVWVADHGGMRDTALLVARLRDEEPVLREVAERGLWRLWSRSGSEEIDQRMADGAEAMQTGRLAEAIAIFTDVVHARPAFAEGWNKRATALFLAGEYRRSIADCDEVLRRNGSHFGALSGAGQNWLRLGRPERALELLRRALAVNPNMHGVRSQIRSIEESLRRAGRLRT